MTSKTPTTSTTQDIMYSQLSANLRRRNNERRQHQQQGIGALPTSLVTADSSVSFPYLPFSSSSSKRGVGGGLHGLLDIIDQAIAIVEGTDDAAEDSFSTQ